MLDKETPQLITLVPCVSQGTKHPEALPPARRLNTRSLCLAGNETSRGSASCEKIKHSLLIYFGGRASDERSLTLAGNERTRKHASCLLQTNIQLFQLREMLLQQIMPELIAPTPSLQQQSACSIIEKAPIIPGYCSTPI